MRSEPPECRVQLCLCSGNHTSFFGQNGEAPICCSISLHNEHISVAIANLHCLQIDKQLRGCIVFTSSASACFPSPFGVTYSATKAFLSSFGAGLAGEVKHYGIDVLVAHPSPVASRCVCRCCMCISYFTFVTSTQAHDICLSM